MRLEQDVRDVHVAQHDRKREAATSSANNNDGNLCRNRHSDEENSCYTPEEELEGQRKKRKIRRIDAVFDLKSN
jgi:hypothetical protein